MCHFFLCSKTCILQVHSCHVSDECTSIVCLWTYRKWSWIWVLVFIKSLSWIIHTNICSNYIAFFLYYPNFYICRLYGATIVCYHAFYLPLLYVTFLADFFQVNIIILQSLLDVLLLPFTSFVPFLLFVTSCFFPFFLFKMVVFFLTSNCTLDENRRTIYIWRMYIIQRWRMLVSLMLIGSDAVTTIWKMVMHSRTEVSWTVYRS